MKKELNSNQVVSPTPEQLQAELCDCICAKDYLNKMYYLLLDNYVSSKDSAQQREHKEELRRTFTTLPLCIKAEKIQDIIKGNGSRATLDRLESEELRIQELRTELEQDFADREKQLLEAAAKVQQYETDMTARLIKGYNGK